MKSRICVGIFFAGVLSLVNAQTFFITAPNFLRLDSNETVGIAVEAPHKVLVNVTIQDHPGKIKKISETILEVQPSLPIIFKVMLNSSEFPPTFLSSPVSPKSVVLNVHGPDFNKEVVIPIILESGYVFIQTDKPIYTPKERANIRIIPLEEDGLPSNRPFRLQIKNPQNIIVEETLFNRKTRLQMRSIVSHNYKFPVYSMLGDWSATVLYGHEFQQNSVVQFELQEYVLPTFTVELKTQEIILPSDDFIKVAVKSRYVYGRNVQGVVTFRLGIKGLSSEAFFFVVIGPRNLEEDGSYSLRVETDQLRRHEGIGWFPQIHGSRFIVEATVVDAASGIKETATDTKSIFSNSPFIISFKRCLKDFKPGLVSVFEADINFADGKPASGIQTKITAEANDEPLELKQNTAVSDKDGKVSFEIQPEMNHYALSIRLETTDQRYEGNQAVGHYIQRKYMSENKAYIALDRSSGQKQKPGEIFFKFVHLEPAEITDIYYMVVSKGKILLLNKMPHGEFKARRLEFRITHNMVPSFRLIVFAHFKDELVADSLKIETETQCHSKAEVTITPEFSEKEPGRDGNIFISGSSGTLVGLLGVDDAVYALSKKDLLTKSKVFSKFAKHDLGCGPGGGLTANIVLGNAGVLVSSNIYTPPSHTASSCTEVKRRKREIASDKLSSYHGLDKECCALGMSHDVHYRTCQERTVVVIRYLKGEHRNCSKTFLECCLYAEEKGFTDMKWTGSGIHLGRTGGDDMDDMHFIANEDEEAESEKDLTVRSDFRETWIFEDILIGADKKEVFPATLPHSITTWIIQAVSVSPAYGICVAEPQELVSFKKVFLQLNLPYSVVRNEQVEIQATVFNYGSKKLRVSVYMYGVKHLCTGAQEGEKSERKRLEIDGQSAATTTFPVIPLKDGIFNIKVVALNPEGGDVIVRKLNVVPEGTTEEIDIPIKLDPSNQQRRSKRHTFTETFTDEIDPYRNTQTTTIKLSLPENFVPGTESCSIKAIGDLLGPTIETVLNDPDKLLDMPHGCGEQNLIRFAPTLYTMRYLKVTGKMTPENEKKGYAFIREGYAIELKYRKDDGSYAAETDRPTSVWLTAFVMKVFCQANELVHIDDNVLYSGLKYLLDHQQPDGSFVESHPIFHVEMMGGVQGNTPMTAFTLIALQECKHEVENMISAKNKAVTFLEQHLEDVNTPLSVAVVAYSLSLANSILKEAAKDKLLDLVKVDEDRNMLHWQTENAAQDIETAGYALLNLLLLNDMKRATSVVNFLNGQQLQSGSFHSTQDTVIALQALAEYAIRARMPSINLVANISSSNDRNFHKSLTFHESNALVLQDVKINRVGGRLFIRSAGHGVGSLAVKMRYNVLKPSENICRFIVTVNVTKTKRNAFGNEEGQPLREEDQELVRGAAEALEEDPDIDPRNRNRRSTHVDANVSRIKRQADAKNNKMILKISICARHLGDKMLGMSIIDVGIFSGFVPEENDLKAIQENPIHLIQNYERSSRGVVFYLRTIPNDENYCFDFNIKQDFNVGNTQTSMIKVYAYYNPDESCTVFYRPDSNSPMIHTICDGGVCQCAEGGCPPQTPFDEVSNLDLANKRLQLKKIACDKYDYVWKGKLDGEIKKEGGFYNISFLIEEVIKAGIEKASILEGDTRYLLARDNCESAWLNPNARYLLLGLDGEKYQNKKGEIWFRYLLDRSSTVYMWTSTRQAKDQDLQRALIGITRKLKKEGCDQ